MTRTRIAEALAVLSTATALFAFAPSEALGQVDETFSAGSNRVSPFQDVAERFPECAGLVAQFDALTAQLYALSDERRIAHHPRTDAIDAEMRSIENERSPVTQQIDDCKNAAVAAQERARDAAHDAEVTAQSSRRLQGRVEQQAPFQLHAEETGGSSQIVQGRILPRTEPTVTTNVRGRILTPTSAGTTSGNAGAGAGASGDPKVDLDVRGRLLLRTELPGDPNADIVADNFTRPYFYAKGVLEGLVAAAEEVGGTAGRLMIASYYMGTGRFVEAQDMLGIKPGETLKIAEMKKFFKEFDHTLALMEKGYQYGNTVQEAYEIGKNQGKFIGGKLLEKYGKQIDGIEIPKTLEQPKLPDSIPNEHNPKVPGEKPQ